MVFLVACFRGGWILQSLAWYTTMREDQVIDDKCGHCLKNFKEGLLKGKTVIAHQNENGSYQCHVHYKCLKEWFDFVKEENGDYLPCCPKCRKSTPLKNRVLYYAKRIARNAGLGFCIGTINLLLMNSIKILLKPHAIDPRMTPFPYVEHLRKDTIDEINTKIEKYNTNQEYLSKIYIWTTSFLITLTTVNMLNNARITKFLMVGQLAAYVALNSILIYGLLSIPEISSLLLTASLVNMVAGVLGF